MSINEEIKEVLRIAGVKSLFLLEGINEVKPHFPLISDDDFTRLIKLDPTYDGSDRLGKYGKWILSLYNNFLKDQVSLQKWEEQKKLGKNYPQPEKKSIDKIEDFDKLPDLLTQFDVINKKVKVRMETIKSISALATIISNEKSKGISTNSQVNHGIDLFKKSVAKGGKIVFKSNKWIVLVPETFESSKVFGEDTNWCTTSSSGNYYEYYLKKFGGKYFINLDLETGDLYQFHFESEQFMDSSDSSVSFSTMISNDNQLKKFYINYIQKSDMEDKNLFLLQLGVKLEEKDLYTIIDKDGSKIEYIKNPSEELQLLAVGKDGYNIQYITKPSERIQIYAVKQNRYAIKVIKNPSEKVQLEAVKQNGDVIQYIKNPSEKVKLEAVKQNGYAIQYINNPSEEVQLEAVKQNGYAITYIANPSEKIKLLAIKQDGYAMRFINNPSEKIKLLAVKQNGYVIQYINNPSEEVQLEAIKQDGYAMRFINNPTEKVQIEAVKQDGTDIFYIKNPSEEVQIEAIKNDKEAMIYIKHPTSKVKSLYKKLYGNK